MKMTPKEKAKRKWERLKKKVGNPNTKTSYDRQKEKILSGETVSYEDARDFKRI